jgi:hypothetical protein
MRSRSKTLLLTPGISHEIFQAPLGRAKQANFGPTISVIGGGANLSVQYEMLARL